MSENIRGAFLMTGSMLAFILNDTLVKSLSDELPVFQTIALRGVGVLVALSAVLLLRHGIRLDYSRSDWRLVLVRSLAEAAGAALFISALYRIPLANITAILQSLPLMLTLAGALFLREPVGWKRALAIVVGFGGVMLIVRPGGQGFDRYSLLAVAAVCVIILRELVTRKLSHDVPSILVGVCAALASTAMGLAGMFWFDWAAVSGKAAMQLAGAVAALMAGYILSVQAMRIGDIAAVTPFRYTGLLFGLVLGYLVFDEWPSLLTLLGAAIVAGTGLFTLFRERRLARPPTPPPLTPQ